MAKASGGADSLSDVARVVTAGREILADPADIFELIADPAQQMKRSERGVVQRRNHMVCTEFQRLGRPIRSTDLRGDRGAGGSGEGLWLAGFGGR